MRIPCRIVLPALICLCVLSMAPPRATADPLPRTKPLTWEGDIASKLIEACDAFILRRLEQSVKKRPQYWVPADAPVDQRKPSVERLKKQLGLVDARIPFDGLEVVATTNETSLVGTIKDVEIHRVRWPAFGGVHGEGLFLDGGADAKGCVIVLPDADQTPEQLCGLVEGIPASSRLPLKLAHSHVNVIVPALISREMTKRNNRANLTHREYIHRSAFILGRTLTGYEVQKVLALVDWIEQQNANQKIGVAGYGEGGMIAFYAGAVDERIDATLVSGYFERRQDIWAQPITRQVFGLLREYGDAELGSMIAPRTLLIEASEGPTLTLPGEGGAPAELKPASVEEVRSEFDRMQRLGKESLNAHLIVPENRTRFFTNDALKQIQSALDRPQELVQSLPRVTDADHKTFSAQRLQRQIAELDRHNQQVMNESPFVRKEFMKDLDTSSLEAYEKSVEKYRDIFREEVIGEYDLPLEDFNTRSRQSWETDKWTGYEVVLDVFDGVFTYGVLIVPKDIKGPDDKRPVVVCQHGLEGRPTDTFLNDHRAYHDFAAKLAERGFITFAPQNIYIFKDRFRTLQRKSYPLGTTLFSIMVPQQQQIVNWLKTLPNVDDARIAFYGLSYGGKSAMRIPALVTDYCLSICSADFNEWVRKNASTRFPFSYVWTGEYEIFEFNLGGTFNYAEMAALIAPRPFMVERGHFDGVGWDEWVAYEYAKVRNLYAAKLGIPDRTEIEFFVGPHTINGKGTFDFLHKHLDWPKPGAANSD